MKLAISCSPGSRSPVGVKPATLKANFSALVLFCLSVILPLCCEGQSTPLRDEITGQAIGTNTTKAIILIHGWNPDIHTNSYRQTDQWYYMVNILKLKLAGTGWKLITYHWETNAATGPVTKNTTDFFGYGNATVAAVHAQQEGAIISTLLTNQAPELRRVQFIAHSAGSWAAREAMRLLLERNPYVVTEMTLLDPFIPDASTLVGSTIGLSTPAMSATTSLPGNDRIYRLENYFADDLVGANIFDGFAVFGTMSTQESFNWPFGNINLQVDWGTTVFPGVHYHYDYHDGPIEFYADTVKASFFGETVPFGLFGVGVPFDYSQVGWFTSLFNAEPSLPKIISQPVAETNVLVGGTASLSVAAIRADAYQWFKNGQQYSATGSTLAFNAVSAADAGEYVLRITNAYGQTFSQKSRLTVVQPSGSSPVIVTPPQSLTVIENQTATFTVSASGTAPSNYQWQLNDADISGANSQNYTTPSLLRANSGDRYRVLVSNAQGSVTSSVATLTVSYAPPPGSADAFEPNDSSLTATPLASGSSLSALISSSSDVDWFNRLLNYG